MSNLQQDLITLRDPKNIKNAALASSPYVLRKIFAADPTIQRLISAGDQIIPLIHEEIIKDGTLGEITLSALVYIVENVNVKASQQIFGALFQKSIENPGPFFVHFAAHAIRSGLQLPIKPLKIHYSPSELIETQMYCAKGGK